jgi:hypothetical protein
MRYAVCASDGGERWERVAAQDCAAWSVQGLGPGHQREHLQRAHELHGAGRVGVAGLKQASRLLYIRDRASEEEWKCVNYFCGRVVRTHGAMCLQRCRAAG